MWSSNDGVYDGFIILITHDDIIIDVNMKNEDAYSILSLQERMHTPLEPFDDMNMSGEKYVKI